VSVTESSTDEEVELSEEDVDEEEEVKEVHLKSCTLNGKKYGRSDDNTVFDLESQEEVGTWDTENKVVVLA